MKAAGDAGGRLAGVGRTRKERLPADGTRGVPTPRPRYSRSSMLPTARSRNRRDLVELWHRTVAPIHRCHGALGSRSDVLRTGAGAGIQGRRSSSGGCRAQRIQSRGNPSPECFRAPLSFPGCSRSAHPHPAVARKPRSRGRRRRRPRRQLPPPRSRRRLRFPVGHTAVLARGCRSDVPGWARIDRGVSGTASL